MNRRHDPHPSAHVLISATSGDLGSARALVKQELLKKRGCTVIEHTGYAADRSEAAAMLEIQISTCDAVVHLVGFRYGDEPNPGSLPPGDARRSYAQMEADAARKLGIDLHVLLCAEDFAFDECGFEPKKKKALQLAYREELAKRSGTNGAASDRNVIVRWVRELPLHLEAIEEPPAPPRPRRPRLAVASVCALLLAGAFGAVWWKSGRAPAPAGRAPSAKAAAVYDPLRVRIHLVHGIEARAAGEIETLDRTWDAGKIAALEETRDDQIADADRFLEQIAQAFATREANADYAAAIRLLAETGVTNALEFLKTKIEEAEKIGPARSGADAPEKAKRESLRLRLLQASLLETDFQWEAAEAEYRAVMGDRANWAEPRRRLARLLIRRGEADDSEKGKRALQEAIELCRGALAATSREAWPQEWAAAQNSLGIALQKFAARVGGAEGQRLLAEAVLAQSAALEVRSRVQTPDEWAATESDLGKALAAQAALVGGAEGAQLFAEAAKADRAALEVRSRERTPRAWAATQYDLASALYETGKLAPGEEGGRLLSEAVKAYRATLEVRTRAKVPRDWASIQNDLGNALWDESTRVSGDESRHLVGEAVNAYRAALEVYTRNELPLAWAATQNNLGNALRQQGASLAGDEGLGLLEEAVKADRAALEIYTREESPEARVSSENNLGNALAVLGARVGGPAGQQLLSEAVQAYRSALGVYTRDQAPAAWAMTENNLGSTLYRQGVRAAGEESQRLLAEAVKSYRFALEVYSPQASPQDWAMTQANLRIALEELCKRSGGVEAQRLRAEAEKIGRELAGSPRL